MPKKSIQCLKFLATVTFSTCIITNVNAQEFTSELTTKDRANFAISIEENADTKSNNGQESSESQQIIPSGIPLGGFVPFLGPEIEKVYIITQGVKIEKYWKSLTPEQWKHALQNQFTQTIVYNSKSSANLTTPVGSGNIGKGEFKLLFHNFRFRNYPCSASNPAAGTLLVGVGLRIDINAKFRKRGLAIGFSQLALAASKNKVRGSVEGNIVGLANSNTLSQVVGAAAGALTYESLVEASKAYAVANQAVENMVALSTPQIFGYRDLIEPGACLKALKAGLN